MKFLALLIKLETLSHVNMQLKINALLVKSEIPSAKLRLIGGTAGFVLK